MEVKKIEAKVREGLRKNKVKQLRLSGQVPAIIYGLKKDPLPIVLDLSLFEKSLKGDFKKNTILDLAIEDGKKTIEETVISYEITKDPLTRKILHIDFMRVEEGTPVKVTVPIKFMGTPVGLKMGGVLIKKLDSVKILSIPKNIPVSIDVELTELNIGDFVMVKDLSQEGYSILSYADNSIVRIAEPRKKEEEVELEVAEGEEGVDGEAAEGDAGSSEQKEGASDESSGGESDSK